jgi:hypothetical protein
MNGASFAYQKRIEKLIVPTHAPSLSLESDATTGLEK